MGLDKLKAMSNEYVRNIDKNIENIIEDKTVIKDIEHDKKEKILNELIERTTSIYELHQENTIKTHLLITEIIKGVQSGKEIYSLFLKAVEALGLCTGDTTLLSVCEKNINQL